MSPKTSTVLTAGTLIFVLFAGSALAQGTMYIENDMVGIHVATPAQEFHLHDGPDANANGAFRISTTSHAWDFATINNNGTFRISKLGTGTSEFDLSAGGNLTISGTLRTGGTTCGGGGCDLVFSPDTKLTPLTEHAEAMWAKGYLPAVGPTPENQPFNLTEKVGGILHELEMAHIYIEQLHQQLAQKEGQLDELSRDNAEVMHRLRQIETRLGESPSQP